MADIRVPKIYEVEPNLQVKKLWLQQQIAEKEARLKRLEADLEEIIRAQTARLQAEMIMLKREIAKLYNDADELEGQTDGDIVEIKAIEIKEG